MDPSFRQQSIDSKTESLTKNNTWKLVLCSTAKSRKVLGTKRISVEKQQVDNNGNTIKYPKSCSVARGFKQIQVVDFGETFVSVVRYASVRVLRGEIAAGDLEPEQMITNSASSIGKSSRKF